MDPHALQILIPVLVILPILYFRMRGSLKTRRLKPQMLLIRPAIIILIAILVISATPLPRGAVVWFAAAAALGVAAGWYWGKLTQLHLHPEDGTVMSTNSQAGVVVLIVLVLFRFGIRAGMGAEGGMTGLSLPLLTDISITFSTLLFSTRALEIYLRAQQLLKGRTGV
jgi:hypothetical protein